MTSRFNWLTILILVSLLSFGCFIFIWTIDTVVSNSVINGNFFLVNLTLGTIQIEAIVSLIRYSKKVIIKDKTLTIQYLFLPKKYSYAVCDLQGYHRNHHRPVGGRLPYHKSFDILAPDGKLFTLNSLIFLNYDQLSNLVAANSKSIKIDKWNYWVSKVKYLIFSIIAAFFISLAILLIEGK